MGKSLAAKVKLHIDENTKRIEGMVSKIERLNVILSDNMDVRCGCKIKVRGKLKNPVFNLVREYGPNITFENGGFYVDTHNYVECRVCEATWEWGQS